MRRIFAVTIAVLLCAPALFAQESRLVYVDVPNANARIEALGQANSAANELITRLNSQNTELGRNIENWQQQNNEMTPIIDRVNAEITELSAVSRSVVDNATKTRAQESLGRARSIKTALETNIRNNNQGIANARTQMDNNRTQIRIQTVRIEDNENEIAYLRAAIARTEAQQNRVNTYIGNVDGLLNDADRFIQRGAGQ